MKDVTEVNPWGINRAAWAGGRIGVARRHLAGAIALLVIIAANAGCIVFASDAASDGQWNVMVVPSCQTVFSGEAKERFNRNCASCHSKDGRAQTPIARQRHVRNLSECKLADDAIIEQILRGTHDKVVDFRMPPFDEKLTGAEAESLVPVVKSFRPVASNESSNFAAHPRLAGIMDFPYRKFAFLEQVANSGRYFILGVNESHNGIELAKVIPEQGEARLWVSGQSSAVTLRMDGALIHFGNAKPPGFLRRLFSSRSRDRHSLTLDNANIGLVLFLYAQLTGRTVLRSPHLPAANLSLDATATAQGPIVLSLQRVLARKGISVIPDGEAFLYVVPDSEISTAGARSSESVLANARSQPTLDGGVFINLANAGPREVVNLYAELTGRILDPLPRLPSNRGIDFTTQTALSREECAYALETLLNWQGLKIVPVGGRSFKCESISVARQ